MNRLTPLILLVVVAVLGYLAVQQTKKEALDVPQLATALFDGVEMRRVASVRLEDIEGSNHLRFEKDDAGRWFMTDPVAWPAEPSLVQKIVQVVQRNSAGIVPEVLQEEAADSFAPPRGFVETTEILESGEKRKVRVELGALDLDGMRVYVRRGGEIFRTGRNFETLFSLNSADFRSKRLLTFSPSSISMVERIGGWYDEANNVSLDFTASPEGYGWRIHKPVRAQGDPDILLIWTRFLASMQAKRFASDRPDVDLARFGLDQPWLTIKVTSALGSVDAINIAAKEGRTYAMRDGLPNVFELSVDTAQRLREPVTLFYEGAFVRVPREKVEEVTLLGPDGRIRLTRTRDGWTVASKPNGVDSYTMELAADPDVVTDFLTAAEKSAVTRYFTDVKPADFFSAPDRQRGIWIKPADDIEQGGYFAPRDKTPGGAEVAMFWREGDSVVGSVDPEFAALCERPLSDYLNRQLWSLQDIQLRGLVLERGGVTRRFKRMPADGWQPEELDLVARELDPVLDYLLFLRARRHIPEGEREALENVVTVTFVDGTGKETSARIGTTATGEAQVQVGPLQAVLAHQDLHKDLSAITAADGSSTND